MNHLIYYIMIELLLDFQFYFYPQYFLLLFSRLHSRTHTQKKVKFLQFRRNLISLTITFKYLTGNSSFCESSLEGRRGPAVATSEILWFDGLPLQMHTIRYSLVTFLMKYVFLKHSHLIMYFVS